MTDLWTEATLDYEGMAREAALARVEAELGGVLPFLLAARTPAEYGHRRALAETRLEAIALRHGVDPGEIMAIADGRFRLYREALAEGICPVDPVVNAARGEGGGPERADQHDEQVDFGPSYGEVPRTENTMPDGSVVQPGPGDPPQFWFMPVTRDEAPGHPSSVMPSGGQMNPVARKKAKKGKGKKSKKDSPHVDDAGRMVIPSNKPGKTVRTIPDMSGNRPGNMSPKKIKKQVQAMRKKAQEGGADYLAETPPDLGTGPGSLDVGVMGQAGQPSIPAGDQEVPRSGAGNTPMINRKVTSGRRPRRDPVAAQITAVAASVRASNPWLHPDEARRIARETVGRYFTRTADDYGPTAWNDSPPIPSSGGSGDSGGGGGTGPLGHALEYKGLQSLMPGGAGGAGAAGGAGGAAEVAELAAL